MKIESIVCIFSTAVFIFVFQYIFFRIKKKQYVISNILRKRFKKGVERYKDIDVTSDVVSELIGETKLKDIVLFGFNTPTQYGVSYVSNLVISYFIDEPKYTLQIEPIRDKRTRRLKATCRNKHSFDIVIHEAEENTSESNTFYLRIMRI